MPIFVFECPLNQCLNLKDIPHLFKQRRASNRSRPPIETYIYRSNLAIEIIELCKTFQIHHIYALLDCLHYEIMSISLGSKIISLFTIRGLKTLSCHFIYRIRAYRTPLMNTTPA